MKNLDKYSIKIHNIIENITNNKGKIFIYSEFVNDDYGGASFISIILEYYGFIRKIYDVKTKKIQVNNACIPPLTKESDPNFEDVFIL